MTWTKHEFAAYELMRSWRERAKLAIELAERGGLDSKISHLAAKRSWDYGSLTVSRQSTRVRDEPSLVQRLRDDVLLTHVPFHLLEWVRVQLAKHQEPGNAKSFIRSHPMMDRWTGSLNDELTQGPVIATTMSRRDVADVLRGLNAPAGPSQESIASFDEFLKAKPQSLEAQLLNFLSRAWDDFRGSFPLGLVLSEGGNQRIQEAGKIRLRLRLQPVNATR